MEFIARVIQAVTVEHPLHTMAVHFPIALTTVALLFVVLALLFSNQSLERAAFYNLAVVVPGTLLAGWSGMQINLAQHAGIATNSNVKFFLAFTLLILALVMFIARAMSHRLLWRPHTMVLYLFGYFLCFALAGTLGFLGGVIVYGF